MTDGVSHSGKRLAKLACLVLVKCERYGAHAGRWQPGSQASLAEKAVNIVLYNGDPYNRSSGIDSSS